MENKILLAYFVYLTLAIGLTLYVARTLFTNGRIFMLEIFHGKADIANATTKLFEVGFYLLNIGYAMLLLRIDADNTPWSTSQVMMETLARKIGGFSIYLGLMLFLDLYLFFRGCKRSREGRSLPPVPPVPVITAPRGQAQ